MIGLIFLEPVDAGLIEKIFSCKITCDSREKLRIVLLEENHYIAWYWYYNSISYSWAIEYCENNKYKYVTLKVSSSNG